MERTLGEITGGTSYFGSLRLVCLIGLVGWTAIGCHPIRDEEEQIESPRVTDEFSGLRSLSDTKVKGDFEMAALTFPSELAGAKKSGLVGRPAAADTKAAKRYIEVEKQLTSLPKHDTDVFKEYRRIGSEEETVDLLPQFRKVLESAEEASRLPGGLFDFDSTAAVNDLLDVVLAGATAELVRGDANAFKRHLGTAIRMSNQLGATHSLGIVSLRCGYVDAIVATCRLAMTRPKGPESIDEVINGLQAPTFDREMISTQFALMSQRIDENPVGTLAPDFGDSSDHENRLPKIVKLINSKTLSSALKGSYLKYLRSLEMVVRGTNVKSGQELDRNLRGIVDGMIASGNAAYAYTSLITQSYARVFDQTKKAETQIALVKSACAVFRRRQLSGEFPSSLPANCPLDPWNRKHLIYKKDGKGFIIYSVGVDGLDNGGRDSGRDLAIRFF